MKKVLFSVLLLLITLNSFAQERGWKFGLNVDPAITWLSAKDGLDSDGSRVGIEASAIAEKYFVKNIAFYVGLSFMDMGGKVKNITESDLRFSDFDLKSLTTAKLHAQYLSFPIGIKLSTNDFAGLYSIYFSGGLVTGFRVGGDIKDATGREHYVSGDVSMMTAGAQFGTGVRYSLGSTYLIAGIKYNHGFTDILKGSALNAQLRNFSLSLGILF